MTKEELEKEAITRVDAFIDNFSQDIRSTLHDRLNQEDVKDFLYGLYIDSAEPREKRIAELKKENAETKERIKTLEYRCENIKDTDTMELVALQRENAELKAFINAPLIKGRRTTRKEFYQTIWDLSGQLTKAKEIIKDLLNLPFASNEEVFADVGSHLDKAEQFLKE